MSTATTNTAPYPRPSAHEAEHNPPNKAWTTVAAREISVKIRDKNFIISTVFILVIMIGSAAFSMFMASRTMDVDIAVFGEDERAVAATLESLNNDAPAADSGGLNNITTNVMGNDEFHIVDVADQAALEAALMDENADIGLIRTGDGWEIIAKEEVSSSTKSAITSVIAQSEIDRNAQAAGTSVPELLSGTATTERLLEPNDGGIPGEAMRYISALVFGFLFYFAAMLFGYAVANSVVEEKQSRIVEILAAAIPIRQLLLGKVLGLTVLATAQVALFAAAGLIAVSFTEFSSILPAISTAAAWYVLFFVLGFAALAALFAAAGALAARTEDVQNTANPVLMIILSAFMGGIISTGTVQLVLSYVPIASTIVMPVRIASGAAQWWEPILALVITVVSTIVLVLIADRIYTRSLMQTSRKTTYREALLGK